MLTDTERIGLFQMWLLVHAMGFTGHLLASIPITLPEWVVDQ